LSYIAYLKTYLIPILAFIVGIVASLSTYDYLKNKQSSAMEAQFIAESKLSIQALHSNIKSNSTSLNALRAFSHSTKTYDQNAFEEFVAPLLADHPSFLVYGWLPKVEHIDRKAFEDTLNETSDRQLTIMDADAKGNLTESKTSPVYFPVAYGFPEKVAKSRVGIDVSSLPVGGPAVEQALKTGKLTASAPLNYTAEFGKNSNIMLLNVVFEHNADEISVGDSRPSRDLLGLVIGVFRVGDLIESQFNTEKQLMFHIQDVTEAGNPQSIYGVPSTDFIYRFNQRLSFAGREWNITSTTRSANYQGRWLPLVILLKGLIITAVVVFGLFYLTHRKVIVEGIVEERTHALNKTVEKLLTLVRRQKLVELKLEERTEELGEAVEKLANSNEELARFAFVCSHDIQEPLRTIRTFSEMLDANLSAKIEKDEESQQYLSFIMNSAEKAQELIREILAYSRIDKDTIKPERFDLNEVVDTVTKNLELNLTELGGRVTYETLPDIVGNKTQIYQLFQNLINNGLKYQISSDTPEVRITVNDAASHWEFSVSDNGIGIKEHQLCKIFHVFERLNSQETYAGAGIGLSICKKVVERHGGKIWAESSFGRGSVFRFTIIKSSLETQSRLKPKAAQLVSVT